MALRKCPEFGRHLVNMHSHLRISWEVLSNLEIQEGSRRRIRKRNFRKGDWI